MFTITKMSPKTRRHYDGWEELFVRSSISLFIPWYEFAPAFNILSKFTLRFEVNKEFLPARDIVNGQTLQRQYSPGGRCRWHRW
jgi:hypothetical protein